MEIKRKISKIISIFFLTISLLLFLYVFYRSEFYHSGTKFNYYLKYCIISLTLITLSVVSFFVSKELKINISTVLIFTIIGLYLVDGYLFTKTRQFNIWMKGKDFDTRSQFEVYLDLKKENKDISTAIFPSRLIGINWNNINDSKHVLLPLSGISNKKTIYCNENGYYSIYLSDRHGFNNPDTEWDKSDVEYLLIGDSFAHGACVNEPNTMAGNIRRMIKEEKGGVLNLGYGSDGPLLEYATLREYLPIVNAKRILWIYFDMDIADLKRELNNKVLLNYLENKNFTQNLNLRQNEIDQKLLKILKERQEAEILKYEINKTAVTKKQNKYSNLYVLFQFIKLYNIRFFLERFFDTPSSKITITQEFKQIIKLSNALASKEGAKFYFVYLTQIGNYSNFFTSKNLNDYTNVIKFIESLNIPIIDIHQELFQSHKDPLSLFALRSFDHYTEYGYEQVVNTIIKKINQYENTNN